MIQTLTDPALFCPRTNCEWLNAPNCPHRGEPGHCRIVEPEAIETVQPVIQKPKAKGLKKLLGS